MELGIFSRYISQTSIFWHIFYQFIIDNKCIWGCGWRPFKTSKTLAWWGASPVGNPCTWCRPHNLCVSEFGMQQASRWDWSLSFVPAVWAVWQQTPLDLCEFFSPYQCSWSVNCRCVIYSTQVVKELAFERKWWNIGNYHIEDKFPGSLVIKHTHTDILVTP